jgi:hypothetical protein
MRHAARKLAVLLFVLVAATASNARATPPDIAEILRWPATDRSRAERTVFLGCQLSDVEIVELSSNLAASGHPGVFLLDSVNHVASVAHFLSEFQPAAVVPVGTLRRDAHELDRRLRIEAAPRQDVRTVARALFTQAKKVVLAPPSPRGQLLQAAALASTVKAPLWVISDPSGEKQPLRDQLRAWETHEVYAVGDTSSYVRGIDDLKVYRLKDEAATAAAALKHRVKKGSVRTLVVTNPHDGADSKGGMAILAPWLAAQKRGLLLLTNAAGANVAELVQDVVKLPEIRKADALLLAGSLHALPTLRRDNPLEGKDTFIEMEPLTPAGQEPVSFATGRLFHDDRAMIALMLARPRLWREASTPKALVVSNPGGGLPFLETFSRNTAQELKNAGFEVTAFFGPDANRPGVRAALPQSTFFLWEGHHSTLVREYEAHRWTEPMRPSLVLLQSCLALTTDKAQPFLERGAIGVIGSTSRNYSGSGGALSLAYVDALVYDKQTLGGSLRSAKNFLLAFALLKEKRMGADAKMTGASQRTAWSFSLWGDPTVDLPRPEIPDDALTAIRHQVKGNTIIVSLPDDAHAKVISARYQTQMLPNARLAGLISKKEDPDVHPLVPLIFREVNLPKAPEGKTPKLRTRLPDANWVFCWDARRTVGYLLIRPRARDTEEIRFHIDWE